MITIRKSAERGSTQHPGMSARHTFSFGRYIDRNWVAFSDLRVINDDRIAAGLGFDMHHHANMEIITYILEGGIAHEDSMGHSAVSRPGDVQRMSAGSGIKHSEKNPSDHNPAHLLQIWIMPQKQDTPPSYEQRYFAPDQKRNMLCLIGSPTGRDGSVVIQQDVNLYATVLDDDDSVTVPIEIGRKIWLQVAQGSVMVNDIQLDEGDGAAIFDEPEIILSEGKSAEILIFDLADR